MRSNLNKFFRPIRKTKVPLICTYMMLQCSAMQTITACTDNKNHFQSNVMKPILNSNPSPGPTASPGPGTSICEDRFYPCIELEQIKYLTNVNPGDKIIEGSLCVYDKKYVTRYPNTPVEIIKIIGDMVIIADYFVQPLPEHYNDDNLQTTYSSGIYSTEIQNIKNFKNYVNQLVPLTGAEFKEKHKLANNARIQLIPCIKKSSIYPNTGECNVMENKSVGEGFEMYKLANLLAVQYGKNNHCDDHNCFNDHKCYNDKNCCDEFKSICDEYFTKKGIPEHNFVKKVYNIGNQCVIDCSPIDGVPFLTVNKITGSCIADEYFENKKNEEYVLVRFAYPHQDFGFLDPITIYYIFEKTSNGYNLIQMREKLVNK